MKQKSVFEGLAKVIYSQGSSEDKDVEGESFKFCRMGEFTLITTKTSQGWIPTGMTFELFGNEFFLTSDFVITLVNEEINTNEVYAVDDENLLKRIEGFLSWRLGVLTEYRL